MLLVSRAIPSGFFFFFCDHCHQLELQSHIDFCLHLDWTSAVNVLVTLPKSLHVRTAAFAHAALAGLGHSWSLQRLPCHLI